MANFYSSTADGQIFHEVDSDPPAQEDWDLCHDAAVGTTVYADSESGYIGRSSHTDSWTDYFAINRSFFYFDTNGVPSVIEKVDLWLYIIDDLNQSLVVMEGTQANPLTTADFDAFTGTEFGHITTVEGQWNNVTFNALGRSKINQSGITKICVREYNRDYLDVMPAEKTGYFQEGYYSENSTYRPYLVIYSDIGIRIYTSSGTEKIQAEALAASHKLRIRKNGTTYGIPLVATSAANALPARINSDGIKTWAKIPS